MSADYLEACNLIFERGIFSRQRVKGMNSPVIENMKDGFQFLRIGFKSTKRKVNVNFGLRKSICYIECKVLLLHVSYYAEHKRSHNISRMTASWATMFMH